MRITLAISRPDKPQVHYLLGYLREEQENHTEAAKHFSKAVELDPDYLNAWKKLQEINRERTLPVPLRNKIVLNVLRLDPLGRHVEPQFNLVSDYAGLWNAVEKASKLEKPKAKSIYPLKASADAIKEALKARNGGQFEELLEMRAMVESRRGRTPANALFSTAYLSVAESLITGGRGYRRFD